IVADFINWAKRHGVPVGPGRGSGAGSLVAYSLGITDLDPLRYALLFERCLNPERVSMPDFDIDFCQDGRDRVIDYVRNKYGAESVSHIATLGTMSANAVARACRKSRLSARWRPRPWCATWGASSACPTAKSTASRSSCRSSSASRS